MKQLFAKKTRTIAFVGTIGILSFTLMAKPTLETIKAYINPSLSYTLDGEKILTDSKTLTYDNKIYVPLTEVAKLIGVETKFENNTFVMTTKPQELPTPEVVTAETIVVPKAVIKDVKVENKTVTILEVETENKTENYMILNILGGTRIVSEDGEKTYTLADLKADMEIEVKHSVAITSSLPTQVVAFEIKVLDEEEKEDEEDKDKEKEDEEKDEKVQSFFEDVKIVEVSNSGKYIVIEGGEAESGQLKIAFNNKTKVKYQDAKKRPNANALKVGEIVSVKVEGDATSDDASQAIISEITVKKTK